MLQALKLLMQVMKANSEDAEPVSLAIDVVSAANDNHLTSQLIEFLLGETDGIPKVSVLEEIRTKHTFWLNCWHYPIPIKFFPAERELLYINILYFHLKNIIEILSFSVLFCEKSESCGESCHYMHATNILKKVTDFCYCTIQVSRVHVGWWGVVFILAGYSNF